METQRSLEPSHRERKGYMSYITLRTQSFVDTHIQGQNCLETHPTAVTSVWGYACPAPSHGWGLSPTLFHFGRRPTVLHHKLIRHLALAVLPPARPPPLRSSLSRGRFRGVGHGSPGLLGFGVAGQTETGLAEEESGVAGGWSQGAWVHQLTEVGSVPVCDELRKGNGGLQVGR